MITVVNRSWLNPLTGYYAIKGVAKQNGPSADLSVAFHKKEPTDKSNYHVIDTDYDSYAVVYDCSEMGLNKGESFWILARENTMELDKRQDILDRAREAVGYDTSRVHLTSHVRCEYDWSEITPTNAPSFLH